MLENIKSKYVLINVFSYLNIKPKLTILLSNKYLYNKTGISPDSFKFYNQKYIEYESDTKVKEYNRANGKLIYHGEYLNKKRNGIGLEINELECFEGEFNKGKRHGKGAEFNKEGKLSFEGEYINGKRNGKGTEYFSNGEIKFEGDYFDGKRWNGKGYHKGKDFTLSVQNFLEYGNKNDIENNDMINKTVFTLKYGSGFAREYDNYSNLIFEGWYINGMRNGKGKEYANNDIIIFEGEYLNGKRNGLGKEYNEQNELIFQGEYKEDKKWNGKGKEYNEQGELIFQGEFKEGKKWNGKGEIISINDKNKIIIYNITNGEGYIKEYKYYNSKIGELISEWKYKNGEKNGKVNEYDKYGTLIFSGEYYNGKN